MAVNFPNLSNLTFTVTDVVLILFILVLLFLQGMTFYFMNVWRAFWAYSGPIGLGLTSDGRYNPYRLKPNGPAFEVRSGQNKGRYVLPGDDTAFIHPKGRVLYVFSETSGMAYSKDIIEYKDAITGKKPEWLEVKPPRYAKNALDLLVMYIEYKLEKTPRPDVQPFDVWLSSVRTDADDEISLSDFKSQYISKYPQAVAYYTWHDGWVERLKAFREGRMKQEEVVDMAKDISREVESDPDPPAWLRAKVLGRIIDMRKGEGWYVSPFNAADLAMTEIITENKIRAKLKGDVTRLMVYALVFIMIMVGAVIAFRGLGLV